MSSNSLARSVMFSSIHRDDADAAPGDRLDLGDLGVLGDLLLELAGHQVFHLLGGRTQAGTDGQGHPDRDVGILALGHVQIGIPAPDRRRQQQHPGHLARLGEEPGGVGRCAERIPRWIFRDSCVPLRHSGQHPGRFAVRNHARARDNDSLTRVPTPLTAIRLPRRRRPT